MSDSDGPELHVESPVMVADTFCTYLARQLVAKKGYQIAHVPEATGLVLASDVVLTMSDGLTLNIVCLIDRQAHPGREFALSVEDVREIGNGCLHYTGRINGAKMPLSITIVEVGPPSPGQEQRLRAFKRKWRAKVIPAAIAVDPASGRVWCSHRPLIRSVGLAGFIERLLSSPREADADLVPRTVETAPKAFPVLTVAILAVLAAIFAAEIKFGLGPLTGPLQPSIATLVAMGGLARSLVFAGDWYRMLSAPFLHIDITHLLLNGLALFVAGRRYEHLVGRLWFGLVYAAGAVCGSVGSLLFNDAMIVSVGASGAITGLFAAMLVTSRHFPAGPLRTALQMTAIYVLIPALLPLTGVLNGKKVDYGAHFGGAIGGVAVGLLILAVWSSASPLPGGRRIAAAIASACVLVLAYPVIGVARNYQRAALVTQFIPVERYPKNAAEVAARAQDLAQQYPRDPRAHLMLAGRLFDLNDRAGAEREARAGLAEEDVWRPYLPMVAVPLRAMLAASLDEARRGEALTLARPVCDEAHDGPVRRLLDTRHLCGS
ncbi:rhomboid family intramembrane serine protease [Bradyrhizobium sp. U87765 SZCCT0131]|uniref:rhomboid family intramembrane serine protease n=1 Tax=unclassified Bradyrhizobium TaxID=2631580 RepID=UPI001BA8F1DF|nr:MULTISPECIES: rhomboid family intramembrane serine protease [unclassified Bradyrhizobium]MBR1217188.1 rhomboid family intramembrane serine protease [Bradyrhizobium sp. U87765 SZCCT0131]MBR1259056.1 rhomboid family intramembrane serine protease [Bradyrhizobium sp. U87765 SZCCT0134]MBR1305197.1 rhomboid family intramembrane serine protease [Bradyrhizobium sp. U87765 SZCCT0110]MBR1320983.1 rhomboid family intramembrane serine protease [Bradyrhizobium sp. U87765 SZCCT0109]MBR1350363.1 rhomboid 